MSPDIPLCVLWFSSSDTSDGGDRAPETPSAHSAMVVGAAFKSSGERKGVRDTLGGARLELCLGLDSCRRDGGILSGPNEERGVIDWRPRKEVEAGRGLVEMEGRDRLGATPGLDDEALRFISHCLSLSRSIHSFMSPIIQSMR